MGLSRSARISLLLAIDVLFFFVELFSGYAVGSLALVADSFHMLNDVMSLIVALYAIKLTEKTPNDSRYSYGWHRAEILAALVNGVFLLALCFSIFIEAIGRFFSTPDISNPMLIVIVGSLGLASNVVGLFLFHEHGHSHGHSHSHTSTPQVSKAPSVADDPSLTPTSPSGRIDIKPNRHRSDSQTPSLAQSEAYSFPGHPAINRITMVQAAQEIANKGSPAPHRRTQSNAHKDTSRPPLASHEEHEGEEHHEATPPTETDALLGHNHSSTEYDSVSDSDQDHGHSHGQGGEHNHSGSMNMHAVLLHVMGDALGNVGVIATGLIIWLTEWKYKYYFDPVISLVITVIIFSSALPLCRSTAFILLQGVPHSVSIDKLRRDIAAVDGVMGVHELHVWQLSESKIVASVHVTASRDRDFMPVASEIRRILHVHGVHSSTIQPEYHHPQTDDHTTACLITCPPDKNCDPTQNACCPPPPAQA